MSARLHLVTNPCDAVLDYVYGELTGASLEAFKTHLATCATCQATVASWGQVRTAVKELPSTPLPESRMQALHNQLMLAAAQEAAARKTVWARVRRVTNAPAMLAAMTILVVGGAIVVNWTRGSLKMPAPAVTVAPAAPVAATPADEPVAAKDKAAPQAQTPPPPPAAKVAVSKSVTKGGKLDGEFYGSGEQAPVGARAAAAPAGAPVVARLREEGGATTGLLDALDTDGRGGGSGNAGPARAQDLSNGHGGATMGSLGQVEHKAKKWASSLGGAKVQNDDFDRLRDSKEAPADDERPAAAPPAAPPEENRKSTPAKPSARGEASSQPTGTLALNAQAPVAPAPGQSAAGASAQATNGAPPTNSAPATNGASAMNNAANAPTKKQASSLLDRADALADAGQCDAARKLFAQANADDSTRGRLAQVRCLRRTGRYRQAQTSLDALKSVAPSEPKIAVEQQSLDAAEKATPKAAKAKAANADTVPAY